MDRKIVEMLAQRAAVKVIARSLHVGKKRIKRLRGLGRKHGYLAAEGYGPGPTAIPAYPEALFPDRLDGRSEKLSREHELLDGERGWIKERLEVGWQPITVFEELPERLGGISRSSFYRYLKRAGLDREGRHYRRVVPEIVHAPGEALLVDWGKLCNAYNPATGKTGTAWAFVGVMGYSRLRLVRLVWRMDVETTLEALADMFRELGGVPRKVTMDNAKCISLEASRYEAALNPVAERFAGHYGFFFECLPPAEPQMKGHVERQIPYVRRLRQSRDGAWENLDAEEAHLRRKLALANEQLHGTTRRRPREVFAAEEREALKPLPSLAYEVERYHEGLVRQDGYVRFDSKYYAAGGAYIGKTVSVIADSKQVALYHEGRLLEVHGRLTGTVQMKAVKEHQLKPWEKSLQDGAFYIRRAEELGPNVKAWVEAVLKQGQGFVDTRRVWGVLSLDKRYGRADIDGACGRALAMGSTSYRMVMKLLAVTEALGSVAVAAPAPVGKSAGYKYTRSMEEYQTLLPIWRRDTEGHA